MKKCVTFYMLLVSCSFILKAQPDSTLQQQYPYINIEQNILSGCDSSENFNRFLYLLDSLIHYNNFQLNIVHFGGSHIQADVHSNYLREKLQLLQPGLLGPRGMIFPYKLAQTNNPNNFKVEYKGKWDGHRSSVNSAQSHWGVTGITASTRDDEAEVKIFFKEGVCKREFSRIRVFHNLQNTAYTLNLFNSFKLISIERNPSEGYTLFEFEDCVDSFVLKVKKNENDGSEFELYGILLESDDAGIVYHSIGVNGASFRTYFRCDDFANHLKFMNPHLAFISIGTNDSFDSDFTPELFEARFELFLSILKSVNPEISLLLTVPNDSYFQKKYNNKNTILVQQVILKLADKYQLKIWDFYNIMGGSQSAEKWYQDGLMKNDRIHFTTKGYELKGELLYQAMMKAYQDYLQLSTPAKIND